MRMLQFNLGGRNREVVQGKEKRWGEDVSSASSRAVELGEGNLKRSIKE